MQKYRYYLPPRSKLPFAAGILAGLMTLNTIYTLISMPYYTHYWDYWATMVSGILLCGFCFLFRNRHAELTLIPAAMLALIACITPRWTGKLFRVLGVLFTLVGGIAILSPMAERISSLAERGNAVPAFVVPFVIRSLGGDLLILLTLLLLVFAMQPHVLPGWMDEGDQYDRIWE